MRLRTKIGGAVLASLIGLLAAIVYLRTPAGGLTCALFAGLTDTDRYCFCSSDSLRNIKRPPRSASRLTLILTVLGS